MLVVLLAACGGATDQDDDPPGPGGQGEGDVVVNEDVRVLDRTARQELAAFRLDTSQNEGELRFPASSAFADQIEAGRILASEPIDGVAPRGFLQRVESRRTDGDEIVVTTSQATLVEAFDRAEIRYEQALAPGDVVEMETRTQGIEMRTRQQPLGFDFTVDFDHVLVDGDEDESTTDDQLALNGSLSFNAGATADIDIDWGDLERFMFRIDLEESARVDVRGNAGFDFEERIVVARYDFGSFTISVGPVPVVFNLSMRIDVGADGSFDASLVAEAVQETAVTLGAEYTGDDGWRNLSDVDSSFTFPPPEISAAGEARAWVEPRVSVKIYGLLGPFVLANAYVETDAQLYRSPFWRLSAGLDFGVGFDIELPVIGHVARFQRNFEGFRRELGVADNEGPTLEIGSPTDGERMVDGQRLGFEVTVRDREQEYVDVRVREGGETVAEERVQGGISQTLFADPICTGSHAYRITATDDEGAEVSESISVIAENFVPEVSVDRGNAPPPFAGGYLIAFADARDRTCEERNAARPELISWYVNNRRVGSTEELLYRVPPSEYGPGDTIALEARYDDGTAVGRSPSVELTVADKPAGTDLEPSPVIRTPVDGEVYKTTGAPLPYEGVGIDTEDGKLRSSSLLWEIEKGGGWYQLGNGETGQIDHFEIFEANRIFGTHRLRLTVTDSAGQSVTETVSYYLSPEG